MNTDSAPPFSEEAEQAVIGAVLINPDTLLTLISFLKPDHFFLLKHRMIFAACLALHHKREPVDFLTVQAELSAAGKLKDVGGAPALLNLVNNTPTSIHAEVYGQLVYRAAVRRRLLEAAARVTATAKDETLSLEDTLSTAQSILFDVLSEGKTGQHEQTAATMTDALLDYVEGLIEQPDRRPAVTTGLRDLDHLLMGGFWPSDVVVLAGRPGSGKTALMLEMATACAEAGVPVGITSLEMDADALMRRVASSRTGIPLAALRTGHVQPQQWAALLAAATKLRALPLITNDKPAQTVGQVYACLRRWKMETGLRVAFLDYIGLLHAADKTLTRKQQDNRARELDEMMTMIKQVARELKITFVVAAQLNRAVEQRADKRPVSADLRESGGLENTADIVALLFREVMYNEAVEDPNKAELIVTKHRNGPTDTVILHYDRELTKFSDARRVVIDFGEQAGGRHIERALPRERGD